MDASVVFWAQIPGPRAFARTVAEKLNGGGSFCLGTRGLPWPDDFRSQVRDRLYAVSSSAALDLISSHDMGERSVLQILSEHIGMVSVPQRAADLLEYLPEGGLTVWLMDLTDAHLREALSLMEQTRSLPVQFVVETTSEEADVRFSLTKLDLLYFSLTLIMEKEYQSTVEYAAHLLTELCAGSAQRVEDMLSHLDTLLASPLTSCPWLDGTVCKQAVYSAQIQVLLPLIERERLVLTESLSEALQRLLPFTDEYMGVYQKPPELELRHLIFFLRHGGIRLSAYDEYRLNLLYEARNDLSHLEVLPLPQVRKLLALEGGA